MTEAPSAQQLMYDFVSMVDRTGVLPSSLKVFAEQQSYELDDIKAHYNSLLALEQSIYHFFFVETMQLLERDEGYAEYNLQERALAFYYSFFELLSANRVYANLSLKQGMLPLQNLPKLNILKKDFQAHVKELCQSEFAQWAPLRTIQAQSMAEAAWLQFLSVLAFWLEDNSEAQENTDVFIEKVLAAGFELWTALDFQHNLDLARFLFERLVPMTQGKR